MKLYVGNIANGVSEQELSELFSTYGQVLSARIIKDKFSGESRGFGFVEMGDTDSGQAAIAGLNGADLKGQSLRINEARPPQERPGGGSRGGFGGGRGGSGGGFGGPRGGGSRGGGFGGSRY